VGKSTLTASLASSLRARGLDVGVLDLDVHGPSLPNLLDVPVRTVERCREREGNVMPLVTRSGIKAMSLGYMNPAPPSSSSSHTPDPLPTPVRGPLASRLTTHLLTTTTWGPLDILLLDLPPGTSDVHLSLAQSVQLSGSVIVTTPGRLSGTEARKGTRFFRDLGVETVAVVENMSYYIIPDDVGGSNSSDTNTPSTTPPRRRVVEMFGPGGREMEGIATYPGAPKVRLPMSPTFGECMEEGEVFVDRVRRRRGREGGGGGGGEGR